MIIEKQSDVTAAVLEQLQQSSDPRFKEIMTAAVTHLHGFIRDARLSEAEFHQACALIARLGQLTTASHNEVVPVSTETSVSAPPAPFSAGRTRVLLGLPQRRCLPAAGS